MHWTCLVRAKSQAQSRFTFRCVLLLKKSPWDSRTVRILPILKSLKSRTSPNLSFLNVPGKFSVRHKNLPNPDLLRGLRRAWQQRHVKLPLDLPLRVWRTGQIFVPVEQQSHTQFRCQSLRKQESALSSSRKSKSARFWKKGPLDLMLPVLEDQVHFIRAHKANTITWCFCRTWKVPTSKCCWQSPWK